MTDPSDDDHSQSSIDPQTPGGGHPPALASSSQSAPDGRSPSRSSDDDRTSADSKASPLTNTRAESSPDPSVEDRPTQPDPSDPRDQAQPQSQLTCHRQIGRQATSAVAYTAEPPAPDDPLLSFTPVPRKQYEWEKSRGLAPK